MRQRWISREAAQLLAVIPGAMLGTLMTVIVKGRTLAYLIGDEHWRVITTASMGIGFGAVITLIYINRERAARVQNTLLRAEAEKNLLERQVLEARLQLMQAQIEPHFLFNTLASVRQLILTDPEAAAKMQGDLIKYLRAAIPQMRESTTTLAREAELSRAYLDILKVRMENRLGWTIDIPPALGAAGFPPMMLPTLVENAIKHGLEPLTQGGEIRISATAAGGKLRVSVADTGAGFADEPGGGVGLTNVRERLASLYGKQAQLIVEPNRPRGAIMTIEIPYAGGEIP
jgi:LytS/YehU family sensor histidine kinase